MPSKIELLGRGTAVDEVLDWFVNYIEEKKVAIDDSLPTEAEICERTGISRNSVREATTHLRALGIVESRPRVGMRLVRDPSLIGLQRLLTCKRVPEELFKDVSAFRDCLEIGIASEVCEHIADHEIDRLEEVLNEIERNENDIMRQFDLDLKFHILYLHAAHNMLTSSISHILEPLFGTKEDRYVRSIGTPLECMAVHRKIIASLRKRDLAALLEAILEHVTTASWPHYKNNIEKVEDIRNAYSVTTPK